MCCPDSQGRPNPPGFIFTALDYIFSYFVGLFAGKILPLLCPHKEL